MCFRVHIFSSFLMLLLAAACSTVPTIRQAGDPPGYGSNVAPETVETSAESPGVCRWNMPVPPEQPLMNQALAGTRVALQKLKSAFPATAERPLRVVHYGDSHSLGGIFARTLRKLWTSQRPISPGFVTPGHPYFWAAKVERGDGWERQNWLWKQDTGPFGPMGLGFIPREGGATMTLEITDRNAPVEGILVDTLYAGYDRHAAFELYSGKQRLAYIEGEPADSKDLELRHQVVTLPPGSKTLTLHVLGKKDEHPDSFRFFGFVVRYPESAVEWHSMGVGGTRAYHPGMRGDSMFDQFVADIAPGLLLIWFGTNTGVARELDEGFYERQYEALLSRLREQAPDAACVMVGPPDMMRRAKSCFLSRRELRCLGKRTRRCRKRIRQRREIRTCRPDDLVYSKRGRTRYPVRGIDSKEEWESYKQQCAFKTQEALLTVIRVQRRLAMKYDCVYFDTFANMGGSGSVWRWACEQDPVLARDDLIHLTNDGYRLVADSLFKALRYALDNDPCQSSPD